jgi:hypothetical protein
VFTGFGGGSLETVATLELTVSTTAGLLEALPNVLARLALADRLEEDSDAAPSFLACFLDSFLDVDFRVSSLTAFWTVFCDATCDVASFSATAERDEPDDEDDSLLLLRTFSLSALAVARDAELTFRFLS